MFPDFPLPSVHLNGTGRDTLSKEYLAAYEAARKAFDALADCTCNARDYYVQSEDAYSEARKERDRQLDALRNCISYIEAHVAHLLP